jgi:hypothetical protein
MPAEIGFIQSALPVNADGHSAEAATQDENDDDEDGGDEGEAD